MREASCRKLPAISVAKAELGFKRELVKDLRIFYSRMEGS